MNIWKHRGFALVFTLGILAWLPAVASVPLDFQVAYDPANPTHIRLRAVTAEFVPTQTDLRAAAAVAANPEELAVLLFLAREGSADMPQLRDRRSRGESWSSLMSGAGIAPGALYMALPANVGRPYAPRAGYKLKSEAKEGPASLSDANVEELINLRVVVAYYDVDPMQVIEARRSGRSYARIHQQFAGHPDRSNGMQRISIRDEEPGFMMVPLNRGEMNPPEGEAQPADGNP